MSGLFGDDDFAPSKSKSSLFDEGATSTPSRPANSSSIFADSTQDSNDSPWGFTPTQKSMGRDNLVKTLLADADVPELYIDSFDSLQVGGFVSAQDCKQLLSDGGIRAPEREKILGIVSSRDEFTRVGRGEFNVLLALIGLAQEGEELGLDAVDERKRKLPSPALPTRSTKKMQETQHSAAQAGAQETSAQHSNGHRKPSFGAGFGESDPWASPQMHKGHGHLNGGAGQRTTSTFTTTASDSNEGAGNYGNGGTGEGSAGAGSWGASSSYGAGNNVGFAGGAASSNEGSGFNDEGNGSGTVRRPAQPRAVTSKGVEELVTVNLLDEKEGMFMFQHRNYEVASVRRNSKVIRRYSDFVWLLDCLHKRYPFRQLPLLPPKRVAINGNHIAADATFIEKRRRGLARFANALVRHPVLREEQLVIMFLTVPTELAVWRKQATISVQEEFVGRALPAGLEDSLPQNLLETFDTVRSGVRRSADLYINLCNITERLCKRKDAFAAEYGRMVLSLNSVTEASNETYNVDTNEVPLLNEGIKGTAKHIGTAQSLIEDEARAWDEGLLEDFKTVRDALVSTRDMFDRRDRNARDNIPALEKRIAQNEQKLANIRAKGDAAKPGEAEKVGNAITADKQSIVDQHARGVFIKECIRDELYYFQNTQHRITRLHQDWAQERIKYAELHADNERGLADAVEGMPQGE